MRSKPQRSYFRFQYFRNLASLSVPLPLPPPLARSAMSSSLQTLLSELMMGRPTMPRYRVAAKRRIASPADLASLAREAAEPAPLAEISRRQAAEKFLSAAKMADAASTFACWARSTPEPISLVRITGSPEAAPCSRKRVSNRRRTPSTVAAKVLVAAPMVSTVICTSMCAARRSPCVSETTRRQSLKHHYGASSRLFLRTWS